MVAKRNGSEVPRAHEQACWGVAPKHTAAPATRSRRAAPKPRREREVPAAEHHASTLTRYLVLAGTRAGVRGSAHGPTEAREAAQQPRLACHVEMRLRLGPSPMRSRNDCVRTLRAMLTFASPSERSTGRCGCRARASSAENSRPPFAAPDRSELWCTQECSS